MMIGKLHLENNSMPIGACKKKERKRKATPVTGCETSRLPHFLDNRLTDGGEIVSLMSWLPFTTGRFLVIISDRG
jgi:hypothetical protein